MTKIRVEDENNSGKDDAVEFTVKITTCKMNVNEECDLCPGTLPQCQETDAEDEEV